MKSGDEIQPEGLQWKRREVKHRNYGTRYEYMFDKMEELERSSGSDGKGEWSEMV